jgi:Tfp pilus assembly protein PilO
MLKAEIQKYDEAINKSEELIAERDRLIAVKNSIDETSRKNLEKLLPDSIDNIRLIIDINNIARRYGLVMKNLHLTGNEGTKTGAVAAPDDRGVAIGGNDTIGSVTISFSVNARYETFKQFMKDLEDSLRLVDVTDFSLKNTDKDYYDFDVTLKTYWLR